MTRKENKMEKFISAGDIYTCNLGNEKIGSEQKGIRPVVVISNAQCCAFSPTVQVLPITSQTKSKLPTHHILYKEYYKYLQYNLNTVLGEQIITVDKSRLGQKICNVTPEDLYRIIECAKKNLPF